MSDASNKAKAETLARIRDDGVVPILRTPTAEDALELSEILREAGIGNLEIPLTVPGALDVIRELSVSFSPELVVGAGTVLKIDDAIAAQEAGARFVVTPVFDAAVISFCRANGLACFPGALTPTEILTAWNAGADAVKVFPVSAMGGADYLRAVKGPLPQVSLLPTGGITLQNVGSFIAAGAYAVGVGGDLVDVAALREQKRHIIAERATLYRELIREARNQRNRTPSPAAPKA